MAGASPPPPPPIRQILAIDTKLSHYLHKLFHPYLPTTLLLLLELSADFRFSFPISVAVFLSPIAPSLLPLLSPLVLSLLLDLCLVGLLKVLLRRRRPPYNPNMSPAVSADHFSFPSGHASRVFLLASLICLSEGSVRAAASENRVAGGFAEGDLVGVVVIGVWVWAGITAMSRVLLGRHFVLDVLAGSVLGVLEGLFAFRFLHFENYFSMLLYQKAGQVRSPAL